MLFPCVHTSLILVYGACVCQVAAKDTEIGTWSDWSVAVHATPWIEDPLPITSTTEGDFVTGR